MEFWDKIRWWINEIPFLFKPEFRFMDSDYDEKWDEEINQLIKTEKFSNVDYYYATIGKRRIWVQNYPYACYKSPSSDKRPSRHTIYNIRQILENHTDDKIKVSLKYIKDNHKLILRFFNKIRDNGLHITPNGDNNFFRFTNYENGKMTDTELVRCNNINQINKHIYYIINDEYNIKNKTYKKLFFYVKMCCESKK